MGQNGRYPLFLYNTLKNPTFNFLDQKKSNVLLKATLQLVANEDCTRRFNKAQIFAARKGINEGQLCAWDPLFKRDSCQGDSGKFSYFLAPQGDPSRSDSKT